MTTIFFKITNIVKMLRYKNICSGPNTKWQTLRALTLPWLCRRGTLLGMTLYSTAHDRTSVNNVTPPRAPTYSCRSPFVCLGWDDIRHSRLHIHVLTGTVVTAGTDEVIIRSILIRARTRWGAKGPTTLSHNGLILRKQHGTE